MRIVLVAVVVIIGANIGINAINSVSKIQDEKLQRLCTIDPTIVSNCEEVLGR